MKKYRIKEEQFSDGTITYTIQHKVGWWWLDCNIDTGTHHHNLGEYIDTITIDYDCDIPFILTNKDIDEIKKLPHILKWLNENNNHICLMTKSPRKVFFAIRKPDTDWTFYVSDIMDVISVFEDKLNIKPKQKEKEIIWTLDNNVPICDVKKKLIYSRK